MRGCWLVPFIVLSGLVLPLHAQLLHDVIHEEIVIETSEITFVGKTTTVQLVSQDLVSQFTGIAIQGFTTSDSLSGYVRFHHNGVWGQWKPLYIVQSVTDEAFLGAYRADHVIDASRFELRFSIDSTHTIEAIIAGTFDQRLDDLEEKTGYGPNETQHHDDFVIIPPEIRRRTEWGAQPFRGTPIPLNRPDYRYMTLHHTAGFSATTLAEGLEQVFRIQEFHQNGRGWSDIGYQFLMDQEGRLYQGRPFLNESDPFASGPRLVQGAHVGGANTGNIGVSLMGCYHPSEGTRCQDTMTPSAIDSLVTTFSFLSERYSLSPNQMRGHRDFNATSCPGDNNYTMISDFMMKIEDLLLRGSALLGAGTLTATIDDSGTVRLTWSFSADYGITAIRIQRRLSDGTIIEVFTSQGAMDGSTIDSPSVGPQTYELIATNGRGAQQRIAIAEVAIEPSSTNILAQTFPNPAVSQTVVRYFIEDQSGIVSVRLFDLNGREVLSGEDQYRESGEWYMTTLDLSTLPGGVYLYRILVDGYAATSFKAAKPLVVMR